MKAVTFENEVLAAINQFYTDHKRFPWGEDFHSSYFTGIPVGRPMVYKYVKRLQDAKRLVRDRRKHILATDLYPLPSSHERSRNQT